MKAGTPLTQKMHKVQQRNRLENELRTEGVTLERVTHSYKVRRITMRLTGREDALSFEPPAKDGGLVSFGDISKIYKLAPDSREHKKAKLKSFKYCLQVLSRSNYKWIFVYDTEVERETWFNFLTYKRQQYQIGRKADPLSVLVSSYWLKAGREKQHDDCLSYGEVITLIHQMFGNVPLDELRERFIQYDSDCNTYLDFGEFTQLYRSFAERHELLPIFEAYTESSDAGMSREEFAAFCQSEDPAQAADDSFRLFDRLMGGMGDGHLPFELFSNYLFNVELNSIVSPREQTPCMEDMHLPLTCYFINSSHNTYLCGDQLTSSSSTSRYRDVLVAGCRCVEIDCWDGPDGNPVVYHGHTATSKIFFEDVIRTINEYAFHPPPFAQQQSNVRAFPVILSLEVHTSEGQSATMAAIMQRIFGPKLLLPAELTKFSPAALQGRLLAKWKMNRFDDDDEKDESGSGIRSDRVAKPFSHDLSACITVGSVKTENWGQDARPFNVQSYVESAVDKLAHVAPSAFAAQNTRMLSRVYPAGGRVTSSNYDPMPAWSMGAHMVALNYQTRDHNLAVNDGFFAHQSGGCGYVLKPLHLRDVAGALELHPYKLFITVISGSHLADTGIVGRGPIRICVKLSIHGVAAEVSTPCVVGNTAHPVWNTEVRLSGWQLELDVCCLQVVALTDGDLQREIASAYVPVKVTRPGHRAIPLKHPKSGCKLEFATILCSARITTDEK